jgi:TonB-dependent receptor
MNSPRCQKLRVPVSVSHRKFGALCSSVLLTGLLGLSQAVAQEKPVAAKPADEQPIVLDTVIVKGVRASLISAQEIKAETPAFVDSIVAQDVGKLPDNTVADALQRIAGIQVARDAGEANTPVIRGLPNLETTINGYEVFTGTGRGVALQDIPAEMLAGVDAYKSTSPDQIEGGVAGLIDVRLRRPFDFAVGHTAVVNAREMYSSQAKRYSPFLSGVINYREKTAGGGEFGVLLNVSYQKRRYEDQIFDNWVHYGEWFNVARDSAGVGGFFGDNFGFQVKHGNRERPAAQLSFQWKNNRGLELYSETLFTGYRNRNDVDFFIGIPSWGGSRSNVVLYPAGYQGVTILDPILKNYGLPAVNLGQTNARFVKSFTATGTNTIISKQAFEGHTNTLQGAFGAKWQHDNVKLNAEFSYNISTVKTRGAILDTIAQDNAQSWNITYNDDSNPSVQNSGLDFTNTSKFVATNLFDQWSRAYSGQYAIKADALIFLKGDFLKSVKFGMRYSDRQVNFHQANPASKWNSGWVSTASLPTLGSVTTNNLFVSNSDMNVRTWWSPSTDYLLDNTDKVRTLGGLALGRPAADPASTFMDTEKTIALYAQGSYKIQVGSMPLDGVFGVRLPHENQTLQGYEHPLDSTGSSITTQWVKTTNKNSGWEVLPTLNGRLHITDLLQLRFSATKTLTRPNFGDLNPALSLFHSGPTSQVGSGSGGNPKLNPIKSTNYDLSLEYYFTKTSQTTVTFFDRELKGYLQSFAKLESVGGTNYLITRPQNTGKGRLKGYEISYQQFFDNISVDALKGLGLQVNFTHINGTTENPTTGVQQPITQVAKKNYNAILIYERGALTTRLAYTVRGSYIDSYNQPGFQPNTVWVQPTKSMDFSASYAINEQFTITFDATNILKNKYKDRFGTSSMFSRDVRSYDTTYSVGARYRF